ncbi:MAG: DUF411 domain-containing protein [Nanoarchaeota archaeon]|nr:DUF411 domain-containing protein [Nanoarchaeota archaeon]
MGKKLFWSLGIILVIGIFFFFTNSATGKFIAVDSFEGDIKIYKSLTCGCCEVYVNYFKGKGNSDVEVITKSDIDFIKEEYKIPQELRTCHTTILGDYFVEGHIPLEAVEKLLSEKPDILGIALPGMPYGSPGMPGNKKGDFVIYGVNHDGTYQEFMRI